MFDSPLFFERVRSNVLRALEEDVGSGDLTASLIPEDKLANATVICREKAVICGRPWVEQTLAALVPNASVSWLLNEGDVCEPNQEILKIEGLARGILTAERTCLNFMQTLSAVATKTATYVAQVAGTSAHIYDTRKTIPGLRDAQKYAVRIGGGRNHRMGLYDAILIKENHINAAGSLTAAFQSALAIDATPMFIQVEVETLSELREALDAGVKMVLLDNMCLDEVRESVAIAAGRCSLEISGGVTFNSLRAYAETGVDRISVGALIKDVKAVDFSMRFLNV